LFRQAEQLSKLLGTRVKNSIRLPIPWLTWCAVIGVVKVDLKDQELAHVVKLTDELFAIDAKARAEKMDSCTKKRRLRY
jgi:hypothetical protein